MTEELLGALSASPSLQTLQLHSFGLYDDDEELSLSPVVLPDLKVLELVYVAPDSIRLLLPLISAQSRELSVRIDTIHETEQPNAIQELRSFLSCSHASRLYLYGPNDLQEVLGYLSAVPNLRTLILHFEDTQLHPDNILAAIMDTQKSGLDLVSLCPKLRTLYLVKGAFGEMIVREAIPAQLLIKKLRLMEDGLFSWLKQSVADAAYESESKERLMHWYDHLN